MLPWPNKESGLWNIKKKRSCQYPHESKGESSQWHPEKPYFTTRLERLVLYYVKLGLQICTKVPHPEATRKLQQLRTVGFTPTSKNYLRPARRCFTVSYMPVAVKRSIFFNTCVKYPLGGTVIIVGPLVTHQHTAVLRVSMCVSDCSGRRPRPVIRGKRNATVSNKL